MKSFSSLRNKVTIHLLFSLLNFLKKTIKYINILIFLLLFVVCVCLSYWANKLFQGQIWKLIHTFILTQCLAHKMDSERFVHGRQNEISDLPTWTKDKNSAPKGIACHLNREGECTCVSDEITAFSYKCAWKIMQCFEKWSEIKERLYNKWAIFPKHMPLIISYYKFLSAIFSSYSQRADKCFQSVIGIF